MSKLLLTVCAFGLLLSSAFAQERTPEQLREERSHIFGIEGQESQRLTRVVASGAKQRIGFFYAVHPDCTASGDVNIRVTKQPEHGSTETTTAMNFPGFPKENIRSKCNDHKIRGMQVNYKSAEKYTGNDEFDLLILFPGGYAWEHHFDISVR